MIDADEGRELLRKVSASVELGNGFPRAWEAAAAAGVDAQWPAWEAWVRRCVSQVKGPKVSNPAGLLIYLLEQGPDCDLSETVPTKRSRDEEQDSYREEMHSWKDLPDHINPPLEEGMRLYRALKDEHGPVRAVEMVREFSDTYPQENTDA